LSERERADAFTFSCLVKKNLEPAVVCFVVGNTFSFHF
jgi:hypothetical protein